MTTLSGATLRHNTANFVRDWRDAAGEEKQEAQQFVRDLLGAYGLSGRTAALYEKRAKRSSTGNQGYIDALVPGLAVIEMKSAGVDLVAAEAQALDYLEHLPENEKPRYVVTCDFKKFRILDIEATKDDVTEFALEDLPNRYDALGFLAGRIPPAPGSAEQAEASVRAAKIMASLYEELDATGYPDHDASVFLVRVLFCLYADDAGVWGERDLFTQFVEEHTADDGSDLGSKLAWLFQVLNQETRQSNLPVSVAQFPYVNGGVFGETVQTPMLSATMRERLLAACAFDWSKISPAIFGSLFQAVKSKEARRELGEHYTTETNILRTINPLFMDELRDKFTKHRNSAPNLRKLRDELSAVRVLDPACGCGNFLVVAYRELRRLDLDILLRLQELGGAKEKLDTLFFTQDSLPVTLDHVAGIELEEWPARIATTALHLVEHQANLAMELALGASPELLPLNKVESIHVGNALRMDWRDVLTPSPNVRIVGNPPFIGQFTKKADQTADMKHVWGTGYDGYLDYVTAWFKKSADYFAMITPPPGGRFAFVSTNSIAQGQPVPALFKPLFDAGWRIRFAHQTFAWVSETPGSAAVHCVITGFDREEKTTPVLFAYPTPKSEPVAVPVSHINAYLVDGPDVFVTKRSKPLNPDLPQVRFGSKPVDGGNLIVNADEYDEVAADPIAAKYLRPFVMGKELIHNIPRWCLWLGTMPPAEIHQSPVLAKRLSDVAAMRRTSTKRATQDLAATPHLFGEDHQPSVPYLGIPRVFSEKRIFAMADRLEPEVIAGDKVYTCPDPDGFAFAIISSSMFITWQKTVGGRLKSDPSFSNTVVWNTLPLPPVGEKLRADIIAAGEGVIAARNLHPERSLAEHYNPLAMDPELLKAHKALDRLVDKAFGAKKAMRTMEDRQVVLFARYAELTQAKE